MHASKEDEIKWKDEFDGHLYIPYGKLNSCGVLIGFSGYKTFTVKKHQCYENGRILISETLIDDSEFILINFYNANTESEQIQTFNELNMLLSNLNRSSKTHIIFTGDFNLFLDRSLDVKSGFPSLKNTL